ncbi:hypothetical protein PLEOSDRAFT_1099689 [Pleurotus ostreatus PC15]|uniref:Translation machinery associated TMA7 n=1 Tax=Pleurotus ostreatus (strain PC15) TaxID=1137138 RepID=A0A067P0N3_PLEO1|nr:hypothetical protein PLEOSDRAFT_1099689 [Pleurotus ostreatus PC15]
MSGRAGGKLKPLKASFLFNKKEETDEEKAFKEKQKQEAAALKNARDKALKGGPLGTGNSGIKKSGKK